MRKRRDYLFVRFSIYYVDRKGWVFKLYNTGLKKRDQKEAADNEIKALPETCLSSSAPRDSASIHR